MILSTSNDQQNEPKSSINDFNYNSTNPYLPDVVEHISEKKYRKASGLKWDQVLNPDTGEIENRQSLILGQQKRLDKQQWYKMFHGSIKAFYGLSNKTMDLFEYIMETIKYGNDKICILPSDVMHNKGLSKATFFRCMLQLLNAKVLAKAEREGCYFINPAIAFKGDRITLVQQYIRDKTPGQYELDTMGDDMTDEDVRTINEETEE